MKKRPYKTWHDNAFHLFLQKYYPAFKLRSGRLDIIAIAIEGDFSHECLYKCLRNENPLSDWVAERLINAAKRRDNRAILAKNGISFSNLTQDVALFKQKVSH